MSDGTLILPERSSAPATPTANKWGLYFTSTGLKQIDDGGNVSTALYGGGYPMEARLSLSSASPVPTTDITGASVVWLLPYMGNRVALYSGSAWDIYMLTSASIAPPNSASMVFDVFGYGSGSSVVLETTNWSGSQVRATTLALLDGIYVKSGSPTKRYLGTCYTSGSGTCEDSVTKRFVWNYYNRTNKHMFVYEATSHNYTTASFRKWNNSDTNNLLAWIVGLSDENILLGCRGQMYSTPANVTGGIALEVNAAFPLDIGFFDVGTNGASFISAGGKPNYFFPSLGYSIAQMYEYGGTTVTLQNMCIHASIRG